MPSSQPELSQTSSAFVRMQTYLKDSQSPPIEGVACPPPLPSFASDIPNKRRRLDKYMGSGLRTEPAQPADFVEPAVVQQPCPVVGDDFHSIYSQFHVEPILHPPNIRWPDPGFVTQVVQGTTSINNLSELSSDSDEWLCFGMATGLVVHSEFPEHATDASSVILNDSGQVLTSQNVPLGYIDERAFACLTPLRNRLNLELQMNFRVRLQRGESKSSRFCNSTRNIGSLDVIVYGVRSFSEAVGELFDRNSLYLQDPVGCDRIIRYENPHRLSSLDNEVVMTSVKEAGSPESIEYISNPVDLLCGFENGELLPESEPPCALITPLLKHQRQALTFMVEREKGWKLEGLDQDLWSRRQVDGYSLQYINNVNGSQHLRSPTTFFGGILSDHMGLGKSLSMIALIASDLRTPRDYDPQGSGYSGISRVRTTLLVVPSSLISQWKNQLKSHLRQSSLLWQEHYGKRRAQTVDEVSQHHLIVTSFETVCSEWRRPSQTESVLFSAEWNRIILDEAHCIRNSTTTTAQAICALRGRSRWAVTGTPIQNKLSDLASLLKFLRICPYSDRTSFDFDITQKWKEGAEDVAIHRVKKLLGYIMLRRSRTAIELPSRRDVVRQVHFSLEEQKVYSAAREQAIRTIDEQLDNTTSERPSYINALQRVNTLRKICNLGTFSISSTTTSAVLDGPGVASWCSESANEIFNNMLTVGEACCSRCFDELQDLDKDGEMDPEGVCVLPWLSRCLSLLCGKCATSCGSSNQFFSCGHSPPCPAIQLSPGSSASLREDNSMWLPSNTETWPTKVRALVEDIRHLADEKAIVFSSWTSTLDMIELALRGKIQCLRLDGKVKPKNRAIALEKFKEDRDVKVLLLSISCGAVGLNLTAASRAYLFEPHWNPTMEEQALARIHRIGQSREVTTIRFVVKDSYEEHVVKVQDRKKSLADILLSKKQTSKDDLINSRLKHLRSLLV